MADAKSEKDAWLNYTIQPFARLFFGSISSMQLLQPMLARLYLIKAFMNI
jgi:hypothetical protein